MPRKGSESYLALELNPRHCVQGYIFKQADMESSSLGLLKIMLRSKKKKKKIMLSKNTKFSLPIRKQMLNVILKKPGSFILVPISLRHIHDLRYRHICDLSLRHESREIEPGLYILIYIISSSDFLKIQYLLFTKFVLSFSLLIFSQYFFLPMLSRYLT